MSRLFGMIAALPELLSVAVLPMRFALVRRLRRICPDPAAFDDGYDVVADLAAGKVE